MEGKVNILLSLSVSQYDWIAKRAAAANVSRSAYIRNLIECKINESNIKEEHHGNKD